MREFFAGLGGLVLVGLLIFGVTEGGYQLYAYFGPKYESTRRDIMLQSRAYSEGETRNVYRLKIQFEEASSPEAKQTIALAARHECQAVDRTRLPADLAAFCNAV